jgi:uncharacterized LabA/DUF88 family protein
MRYIAYIVDVAMEVSLDQPTRQNNGVAQGVQLLIDGENLYVATVNYLEVQKRPSDTAAATEFILRKLGELVDYLEDSHGLRTEVGYYYMTKVGEDALRSRRMLGGLKGQLGLLGIETLVVEKWNEKAGNVDPRLISEAYRLLFIDKKAPSNLVLVSGDKDYEPMLVDYQRQGRRVAVCFYSPVGGGASIDLLCVRGGEFIDFANPKQSWTIP